MRRRDRCRNAAAREDEFFRRTAGERREKEKRGEKGAICTVAREAKEREEDEEQEDEEEERQTRTASADRRSVPIATRRDRARNRHVLHARFSTCVCPRINVHTRQIHFRAARSRRPRACCFSPGYRASYLKEVRSPTGKR